MATDPYDTENSVNPLQPGGFFFEHAVQGLEVARGDKIPPAALAVLVGGLVHDETGWSKLAVLYQIAHSLRPNLVTWADVDRAGRIDEFTTDQQFNAMVAKIRTVLATLPATTLKELAETHGGIEEDERPPMQFSAGGAGDRRLSRVASLLGSFVLTDKDGTSTRPVSGDAAQHLAQQQLKVASGYRRASVEQARTIAARRS